MLLNYLGIDFDYVFNGTLVFLAVMIAFALMELAISKLRR